MRRSVDGCFLIAAPDMPDPNFARTVVFVTTHSSEGAFGLIVNRPAALKVSKLWESVGGEATGLGDERAFVGGPVDTRVIHFLHDCEDLAVGEEPVVPGVFLGNDADLFGSLIDRERQQRESGGEGVVYRAFCGFSGWGEGQLDGELETGNWIVQPASSDLIFTENVSELWSQVIEREGGLYRLFAMMPQNPELN